MHPMPKKSVRRILSAEEILGIDQALIAVHAEYARLRARLPAAHYISRPGIPAIFSESLVARAIGPILGQTASADFGGTEADLRVEVAGQADQLVEVKASGGHGWQEIKRRDLERNLFVWVAFGERFERGSGAIEVYALPEPHRYRPTRRKLTLPVFLAGARLLSGFRVIRFDGTEEMLASPCLSGLTQQVAQQSLEIDLGALGGLD